jgi:RHS repeat-associated protein
MTMLTKGRGNRPMGSRMKTPNGGRRLAVLVAAAGLTMVLTIDPFGISPALPWLAAAADGTSDADLSRSERVDAILAGLDQGTPVTSEPMTGSWGNISGDDGLTDLPSQLPSEDEEVVALDPGATAPAAYYSSETDTPTVGEVNLGGMDVSVQPAPTGETPDAVRIHVAGGEDAAAAGVTGVLLDVTDASVDPTATDPNVDLTVSYQSFAGLVGGDWASRLRMVWIPDCTDATAECQPVELDTVNDPATQTVTATVPVGPGEPEVIAPALYRTTRAPMRAMSGGSDSGGSVAVTAGASGSTGDWGATSLSSAATWGAGGATGGFSWSLPLSVPATTAGPSPELAFSYSSAGSDGKIPTTNNQAGQLGEGFDLTTSYIERSYVPCSQNNTGDANNLDEPGGDLCWGPQNATMVFGASGGELINEDNTNVWKSKNDDGSLIEHLNGGDNGSLHDDYWKVTATDGTQYFFGRGTRSDTSSTPTNSAWTVPVYGNNPGEQCYKAPADGGFADSRCTQVWRWNLEHVIDPSGNTMTYFYTKETNKYVYDWVDNFEANVVSYVSGGRLDRIEYGTHKDTEATKLAPEKVTIETLPRCITTLSNPSSFCSSSQTSTDSNKWPDTPTDLVCSDSAECKNSSPVFFDRYRVSSVSTWTRASSGYVPVDSWAIKQRFVAQGTGFGIDHAVGVMLVVDAITHSGMNGTTDDADDISMPSNSFEYTFLANRVNSDEDGLSPMLLPRMTNIRTEAGAAVTVHYRTECSFSDHPGITDSQQEDNIKLCFPVKWYPNENDESKTEYFHKYVVDSQIESGAPGSTDPKYDLITGSDFKVTTFDYKGGAFWAEPTGAMVKSKEVTFSDFRGFGEVLTTQGTGGEASTVSTRYFRGTGATLSAGPPGNVKTAKDELRFVGQVFASADFDGMKPTSETDPTMVPKKISETITVPGTPISIAENSKHVHAYRIPSSSTYGFTYDKNENLVYRTKTSTSLDEYSMPTQVEDEGDLDRTDDSLCTRVTYWRTPGSAAVTKRMVGLALETEVVSKPCAATVSGPTEVVSDDLTTYDDFGRVIESKRIDPTTGVGYQTTKEVTSYDDHGRPLTTEDAAGHETRLTYTDTATGLLQSLTTTTPNPDGSAGSANGFSSTKTFNPLTGKLVSTTDLNGLVTSGTHDALGRLLTVRYPQDQSTAKPSVEYQYTVEDSGLNAVLTKTLGADGATQRVSVTLYDGLLRPFQTQVEGVDSGANHQATAEERGRMITHTYYDSAGRVDKKTAAWWATGVPAAVPVEPIAVPSSQTTFEYDGAGRPTAQVFWVGTSSNTEDEKWRTVTDYNGATILQIPPMGGTPQSTTTDARGQTIALTQYLRDADTTAGAAATTVETVTALEQQTTLYEYDAAGNRVAMKDPAGKSWTYKFDWAHRQYNAVDPDAGTTVTSYNSLDQVVTRTNGNSQTLTYHYDPLGRTTALQEGLITTATWSYDAATFSGSSTKVLGQLSSSTRIVDGKEYVTSVPIYDKALRPLETTLTLPDSPEFASLQPNSDTEDRSYTTDFSYTADGQVASMTLPAIIGADGTKALGSETVSTRYDSASEPSLMSGGFGWGTYVAESRYSADGLPLITDLGTTYGAIVSYKYDDATKRLTGISLDRERFDGTDLALTYAYDEAGDVTSVKDQPTATAVAGDGSHDNQCFGYDGLQRLQVAWTTANGNCSKAQSAITSSDVGGVSPYWSEYSYDQLGNRTSLVQHGLGSAPTATTTYTMAAGTHQLTSASTTAGSTTTTTSYTYDNAGNRASKTASGSTSTYAWDGEGKLASVAGTPEQDSQNVYDVSGNRIVRTDASGTTVFLPGGQEILINGDTVSATRYYSFAGKTVAVRTSRGLGGVSSLVCDAHGSVLASVPNTTWTAASVKRVFSDPFGAVRGGSDATGSGDRQFLGLVRDAGSGLTLLGARYYDEAVGRFISVDPALSADQPAQFNAYVYSGNNPATWSDPSGLWWGSNLMNFGASLLSFGIKLAASSPLGQVFKVMVKVVVNTKLIGFPQNPHSLVQSTQNSKSGFQQVMNQGFDRDKKGNFHTKPDSPQLMGGYNEIYDAIFVAFTNVAPPVKSTFEYEGNSYVLWAWKGDYINMGSGAEIGFYAQTGPLKDAGPQWNSVSNGYVPKMTMTLRGASGKEIASDNVNNTKPKGWVGAWNPNAQSPDVSNLRATMTVDFSDNPGMFDAFRNRKGQGKDPWSYNVKNGTATLNFRRRKRGWVR